MTTQVLRGNMERPALQRLLADIRAGRIDIVVVYKVDRLTRSLADFARVVGIFDAQGVRFVSVTQQYTRKALPEPLHRWSGLTTDAAVPAAPFACIAGSPTRTARPVRRRSPPPAQNRRATG